MAKIIAYKVKFESDPLYTRVRPEDEALGEEKEAAIDRICDFVRKWVTEHIVPVTDDVETNSEIQKTEMAGGG